MSTQLLISAAGAAVGFAVAGPLGVTAMQGAQLGFLAGSLVSSIAFPPEGQNVEGARLQDLKMGGSSYGVPIPLLFGHPRVKGEIVWASEKHEIATTTTQEAGGGKGGGGSSSTSTTYAYTIDVLILLSDAPGHFPSRIWNNGKLIWTNRATASSSSASASAGTTWWTRMQSYTGEATQLPDATYEADVGTANACAYRGRSTVFIEGLDCGSGGNLPNLTFEMSTVPSRIRCTYLSYDETVESCDGYDPVSLFGIYAVGSGEVISEPFRDNGINIYDTSSPENIRLVRAFPVSSNSGVVRQFLKLSETYGIFFEGEASGETLYVLDMTTPVAPVIRSTTPLANTWGTNLFVIDSEHVGVTYRSTSVIDIYQLIGSNLTLRSSLAVPYRMYGAVVYAGTTLYTTTLMTSDPNGVYVSNLSNLDAPVYSSSFSTPAGAAYVTQRPKVSGSRLVVADYVFSLWDSSPEKCFIYSLANPLVPALLGNISGYGIPSPFKNGEYILYSEAYQTWTLFDIYDPAHPVPVLYNPSLAFGQLPSEGAIQTTYDESRNLLFNIGDYGWLIAYSLLFTGTAAFEGQSTDLTQTLSVHAGTTGYGNLVRSGAYVYAAGNAASRTISAIDVTDYTEPGLNSGTSPDPEGGDVPTYVAVSGTALFSSNAQNNTIYRYSLASPAAPVVVNSTAVAYEPNMLAVSGAYLWVVSDQGRLTSYATAASPLVESGTVTQATTTSFTLAINGNYAYVNNYDDSRISVYDISNPLVPVWSSYITTGALPSEMVIFGNYMYVCCRGSNFQIFDVSTASTPVLLGASSEVSVLLGGAGNRLVSLSGTSTTTVTTVNVYDIATVPGTPTLVASDVCDGFGPVLPLDDSTILLTNNKASFNDIRALLPVPTAEPRLSAVVSTLCLRAGLEASQFDVTALASITQPVRAMAITQVSSVRSVLQMLMASYMFEAVLSDKIYFKPRGQASVEDIPFVDLVGDNDPLPISVGNELEYPAQVSVSYSDVLTDYQEDTQRSDRLLTGQVNTRVVSVPLGMRPTEAKALADKLVFDFAVAKVATEFSLPLSYAHLEPTDVVQVTAEDGYVHRLRITAKRETNGFLGFKAVADDASVLSQSSLTSGGAQTQEEVYAIPLTQLRLLDIPILRDQDNSPGFYLAVGAESAQWRSATVFSSGNGSAYIPQETITATTIVGRVDYELLETAVSGTFEPYNSTVVSFQHSLNVPSSITYADMLTSNEVNLMLIGEELVQFLSAEPASDYDDYVALKLYRLTGLLRGIKGTPTNTHDYYEDATLIQMSGLRFRTLNSAEMAVTSFHKGVTSGQLVARTSAESITPVQSTECLAPINARANRATTDTVITWTRQTRLSTRLFSSLGISAPLGETTESYDIEVYTTAARTVLKRTFTAQTSETVTYTSAQQVTDFGSNQAVLYLRIYQNSEIGGRGNYLDATI